MTAKKGQKSKHYPESVKVAADRLFMEKGMVSILFGYINKSSVNINGSTSVLHYNLYVARLTYLEIRYIWKVNLK
ncbi:hypothetical protein [Paenibacillus ihuae]|uniref:hypothetical protein n=1 Tax=Paenibacillus ihuae TaxID=1232431 RepID=UPI0006D587D8|nr:hypothetical protein [Paenibacillus ihuae]